MTKCSNSRIGNRYDDLVGSGISGGELRRLAFAAEILTNPPILICDEPTSGLDSYLAESVVKMLRKLTNSGRTVICTIHQPSSEVFILFDRLLLLTEGRFAFMGTLPEAQEHFNSLGMVCPNQFNPADHYLRQISIEPGNEIDSQERIDVSINIILKYSLTTFKHFCNRKYVQIIAVQRNRCLMEIKRKLMFIKQILLTIECQHIKHLGYNNLPLCCGGLLLAIHVSQ